MNDSFAQQSAQTPSPSTGSRQATHCVGSAMSSANFAACRQAPRKWPMIERDGVAASMTLRLALRRAALKQDCQRPADRRTKPSMATPQNATPVLFDRALLRLRQERARRQDAATFLLDRVAEDFSDRLAAVKREFSAVADLWTPGALPLPAHASVVRVVLDSDGETLPLEPQSRDLVVSALALQFVNDLPGVLAQIRRTLKPDGLLLAAMVGGDTLTELRQSFAAAEAECEGGVSPRVAPFADLRDVGALLQRAGFALPVTDVDRVVVRYANAFALMQDIRRMGAANVLIERRRTPSRRSTLLRMAEIYAERFADADGRIRATFDIIWLSGWAPHESQQKPLKPGSAKASLAEAVKGQTGR